MENYIVRIYRRDTDHPDDVVGTVECVETQIKRPFHGIRKLGGLLSEKILIGRREDMDVPMMSQAGSSKNTTNRPK